MTVDNRCNTSSRHLTGHVHRTYLTLPTRSRRSRTVPRIGVCLFAVVLAGVTLGQPKEIPEAFTFDPKPTTLVPPLPFWWNVAVSPDGATIVTAHGLERGGEWWVWDAKTGAVTAKVAEPNVVRFVCFSPDGSLV